MPITISPYMSLPVPIVGEEAGPDYAIDLNDSLLIIDQHTHQAGSGVQITTSGLNINADLSINSNNLTFVKSVNFAAQVSNLPGVPPNLGCIYVSGNELVYNDEAGNVVPITNNGSVNAGSGSITGLPSGTASASYSAGNQTFVWQSATLTPANSDVASIVLRNLSASSKGLTLNPPTAMAADINVTMPTPPAATSFVTMDNAGNMGVGIPIALGISDSNIATQTITQDKRALMSTGVTVGVGGYALSTSCGAFSQIGGTSVDITNLTITITTTGRPVAIGLIGDGTGSGGGLFVGNSSAAPPKASIDFIRDVTTIWTGVYGTEDSAAPTFSSLQIPASSFVYIDAVVAGTYTYKIQCTALTGGTTRIQAFNIKLYAYEI